MSAQFFDILPMTATAEAAAKALREKTEAEQDAYLFGRYNLSFREREIAQAVSKGLSNKDVANKLFIVEKTVKFHLTNIYKKMAIKSRAHLVVAVIQNRLVKPPVAETQAEA